MPVKKYLRESLHQIKLHNKLLKWSYYPDKKNVLQNLKLKMKVMKNKHSVPYSTWKNSFEGYSAKFTPVMQGLDVIYYVMGGLNNDTREGSTQNYWVNLRT